MTARDFVMQSLNKESDFGIKGYHMARTLTKLDGPLVARIHAGKKKTFVDMAVKEKAFVPPANYNVQYDWTANKKSNFNRDVRHTIPTDIERKAKKDTKPEPPSYSPKHGLVEPNVLGAFNLKGSR